MKKSISLILTALVIFSMSSFSAHALGIPPQGLDIMCMTDARNVPENSRYIELLMLKDDLGEHLLPPPDSGSEIELYDNDGFVSYSYRCKNADAVSALNDMTNDGFYINSFREVEEDLFYSLHIIKFAYVDKDGNILSVTNPVNTLAFGIFRELFTVNINGSNASLDLSYIPPMLLTIFIFIVTILVFIVPIFIASYFLIRKIRKKPSA